MDIQTGSDFERLVWPTGKSRNLPKNNDYRRHLVKKWTKYLKACCLLLNKDAAKHKLQTINAVGNDIELT